MVTGWPCTGMVIHGRELYHICIVLPHDMLIYCWTYHYGDLIILCSTLDSWYAVASSLCNAAWTLFLVRPSARICELLTKPILLISLAFYAFLAAYMSSIILFSFDQLPLDIIMKGLLESDRMLAGTGRFKINSSSFWTVSAASERSANYMNPWKHGTRNMYQFIWLIRDRYYLAGRIGVRHYTLKLWG